ncbi:S1 domain-containing RNA-binding protein [Lacticaseibacillus rhamnosus]|uniref:S1 domain-containing RNA-binding protein n=1 Tax=Lacticaseibacillus rhamnosus TaxID=47715 RepID=UPI0022EC039C|nr:S1 domain-containing RNA-binding protein [Lacticaseibacillus rhamnosus]MDA3726936.1 S1 domain-containing RNA-binding protein [Lacticaseibacillus rhamnosus]MDA3737675.1 S1 domain-containing RNA-binding protein [Lacticaseibacillus rhamnosus]MDA3742922.1 S1 domain-containing RNA-binding protein [Lacticaseibacillus rhamnosus]MDA3745831.1 S1 domain-containing RNA-binding protein [Lacticaseibacillus rhamnosus]MDA3751100.1 S1 domain-containing RNA-binding protein [Lacticaseibacillus rhamnosus]
MAVEVGTKVAGKVTGITKFGAFVELGDGKTGLVHISEVSDAYVKDIHDVLHVGEPVTVKVLSIQDGKIGLSIRKAVDKPQQRENDHHHENRHASAPHAGNNRFQGGARNSGNRFGHKAQPVKGNFDAMMSGYLKESEDRLSVLRRNTEGKRGGRGGRRS